MVEGESEKMVKFLFLVNGTSVSVGSNSLMIRSALRMVSFFSAGGTHLFLPLILSFW